MQVKTKFQFHKGTIKTIIFSSLPFVYFIISIP